MNSNKNIFYEQQLLAIEILDLYNSEVKRSLCNKNKKKLKCVFPSIDSIYSKDIVIESDPAYYYKSKLLYKA